MAGTMPRMWSENAGPDSCDGEKLLRASVAGGAKADAGRMA